MKSTETLQRALEAVRTMRARLADVESRQREPIAVVGMSCRLPGGASTPDALWELLEEGRDATTEIPADRWSTDDFYDPDPDVAGRMYVRRGGFLQEPVDRFDPEFFGISPREAVNMDPIQRMLLELSWEALEGAGMAPHTLAGSRTGVFVGVAGSDFETLQKQGERLEDIHIYRGTGVAASVVSGRISHVLGLHGPNLALDTACSASLVATALAIESLRTGKCDLALSGGASLMLVPDMTVLLCRMRALATGGRCRTFDDNADGYARGEGGGMLALKRLSDAQADGDMIHAVIRGAAINHDGRSSGLTVPNPVAQRKVILEALENAGLEPGDIGYVEAHGTATPLGDPIELRVLADVLGAGRSVDSPLLVGSVKTNFGHLEAAAGVSGLLKVILSLSRGRIPPHLNVERPTSHIDWDTTPLRITTEGAEWDGSTAPRRAGVSAFGISGTNAHIILEAAPPVEATEPRERREAELITLSGQSREAVRALADRVAERVARADEAALGDIAATLVAGRTPMPFRATAVAEDAESMADELRRLASASDDAFAHVRNAPAGHIAFLFTGQGAQYPGMARELLRGSPIFREAIERCDAILGDRLEGGLLRLLEEEEDPEVLRRTAVAQPALFAVEYALAELWKSWGIEPSYVAGHSLGEYVAATVAGVMTLEAALPLVALRGSLMQELPEGGAMVAIGAPASAVEPLIRDRPDVWLASSNGPNATVISGEAEAVREVAARLEADGARCTELHVSHAFHSHRMDPILDRFQEAVAGVELSPPGIGLVSNLTGELLTDEDAVDPARWRRHIREGVRFGATFETLAGLGVQTFVEVGPHPALSAMGAAALPDARLHWVPSIRRGQAQWKRLLDSLGELYRAGHEIDWQAYARDHGGRRTMVPTYPFQRERHWPALAAPEAADVRRSAAASVNPLLGAPVRSPAIQGWVFEQVLSATSPAYLADHRFRGQVIVPAAAYIEMALAAAEHGPGWSEATVEDLAFERPLVIPDEGAMVVQVVVAPAEGGTAAVRVVASAPTSDEWATVATARIRAEDAVPTIDADDLPGAEGEVVDLDALQASLEARGLIYGPAFRTLQSVQSTGTEAAADAALGDREARDAASYRIHPCLLDASFQLLGTIFRDGDRKTAFLPSGVRRAIFTRAIGSACSLRARGQQPAEGQPVRISDLYFLDADGVVVGKIEGHEARKASGSFGRPSADLVYGIEWVPADEPADGAVEGDWLLLDDEGPVSDAMAAYLEGRGARCVRVPRPTAELAASLRQAAADAGPFAGVVHLWGLDEGSDGDPVDRSADAVLAIAGLVDLAGEDVLAEDARVVFVTRGASGPDVADDDGWQAGAGLWGAFPVLRAEHPQLRSRIVDLDPRTPVESETIARWVFGETDEDRVAIRDDGAIAPRMTRGSSSAADARTPAVLTGENYRIALDARGTLDAIRYGPADREPPAAGEVEVQVDVTGLNFRDVLNVLGRYPGDPGLPGVEFSGTVERVGVGVEGLSPGDEVIGMHIGMFTRYANVPATAVVPKPVSLSHEQAATIPVTFLTAEWGLVHLARLSKGERVLIHSGAGGVGQAAIQVAKAVGAEIFATAGSEEKRAFLRSQGVEHVFHSRDTSFWSDILDATGGEGVDVVLNSLTGELLRKSLDLLGPGGRFIELGKAELLDPAEVAEEHPGVTYEAFELGSIPLSPEENREFFASVAAGFDDGSRHPLPVRAYAADEVTDAFRFMAQARHIGKVVVRAGRVVPSEPIRSDGVYVVTGATGGVGRTLVEWLVEQGAGAIIAASRSAPKGDAAELFDRLRAEGADIRFEAADIAARADVERVLAAADATGQQLRGVFHAAGVLDDRMLDDVTRESAATVLRPKVAGARHLHDLTQHRELDHLVLFSSMASWLGGPGQAAYGAANAWIEALAAHRRRLGLAGLAVSWGPWAEVGMAHRMGERYREILERSGAGLLDPHEALDHMDALMRNGASHALVLDVDWTRRSETGGPGTPLVQDLLATGGPSKEDGAPTKAFDPAELEGLDPDERASRIQQYVIDTLAGVLGLRPERLESDTAIGTLGFDSLMAVELRNRIDMDMDITLSTADLLRAETVGDVAEQLVVRLDVGDVRSAVVHGGTVETFEL